MLGSTSSGVAAASTSSDVPASKISGVPAPEDGKGVPGHEESERGSKHWSKAGEKMAGGGGRAEAISTAKQKAARILKSPLCSNCLYEVYSGTDC